MMPISLFAAPPVRQVGVIGWPIDHSLSPAMHNAAFVALGMADWKYDKYAIPPDIVRHSLREFRDHGLVGLNVTVPLKELVLPHVKADAIATAVGAVNTIVFRDNSGTNTDVAGFMGDLAAHGVEVAGKTVVLLGAGGAARAAAYGLAQAGAEVFIANRTPERAELLFRDLNLPPRIISLDAIADVRPALLVNTTPVGMGKLAGQSPLPDEIAQRVLSPGVTVYDMVYRPRETALITQAQAAGANAIGGLGMLVRQGAESFRLWTGAHPPLDVMMAAVEQALKVDISEQRTKRSS